MIGLQSLGFRIEALGLRIQSLIGVQGFGFEVRSRNLITLQDKLGRPMEYLTFSLMALIGDHIY